jgi:hypothetical protein
MVREKRSSGPESSAASLLDHDFKLLTGARLTTVCQIPSVHRQSYAYLTAKTTDESGCLFIVQPNGTCHIYSPFLSLSA